VAATLMEKEWLMTVPNMAKYRRVGLQRIGQTLLRGTRRRHAQADSQCLRKGAQSAEV